MKLFELTLLKVKQKINVIYYKIISNYFIKDIISMIIYRYRRIEYHRYSIDFLSRYDLFVLIFYEY